MTEIERKALELVNEAALNDKPWTLDDVLGGVVFKALCRAIEQHEAFRQEVSDAVEEYFDCEQNGSRSMLEVAETRLRRFIIAKPDPLFDTLWALGMADDRAGIERLTKGINEELAKRGGRIVFDGK